MELDPMLAELGGCVAFIAVSVAFAWAWLRVGDAIASRRRRTAANRAKCRMWLAAHEYQRNLARSQRRAVARR